MWHFAHDFHWKNENVEVWIAQAPLKSSQRVCFRPLGEKMKEKRLKTHCSSTSPRLNTFFSHHIITQTFHSAMALWNCLKRIRYYPATCNTPIGHGRRSAEPRGARIDSKKSWALPGTFMGIRPHPDPDEGSYWRWGPTVETSSHPINGKHAECGREGGLSIQSFLMDRFSCKAHHCAWITSDMRRPAQSGREGTDWKLWMRVSDHTPSGYNIAGYL